MFTKTFIVACLLILLTRASALCDTIEPGPGSPAKIWGVGLAHAALWTGTLLALDKAWYSDYERNSFHFFNDNAEWNQMDKAGHIWSSYHLSRASSALWTWAGVKRPTAVWLGAGSALAFQSIIEWQDGYSVQWGFSWGDMAANLVGAAAFSLQQIVPRRQLAQFKMSYWPSRWPAHLRDRHEELFGKGFTEQLLKDYNAQTYWISLNLDALFPRAGLPAWLNLGLGYGAGGMLGGRENKWKAGDGAEMDFTHIPRLRYYYIAPDIDLTRIPVRSGALRTAFFLLSAVKVPAPALSLSNNGRLRFHAFKF